jgi:hypothetical protein
MDYPEFLNYMLLGANICLLTINVRQFRWVMDSSRQMENILGQAKIVKELWKTSAKTSTGKK